MTSAAEILSQEIQDLDDELCRNYKNKEWVAIGNMYTEDCLWLQPGGPELVGIENAKTEFSKFRDLGYTSLTLYRQELLGPYNGDTCIERTKFLFSRDDGKPNQGGKSVVLFKKIDGTWRMKWDIFNSDTADTA